MDGWIQGIHEICVLEFCIGLPAVSSPNFLTLFEALVCLLLPLRSGQ